MNLIEIHENGIYMVLQINEQNEVKLLHFSALPFQKETIGALGNTAGFYPVELAVSGQNPPNERFGTKYVETSPGYRLKYRSHKDYRTCQGRKLEITTEDTATNLAVTIHYQFFDGVSVVRSWTEVCNEGNFSRGLEYVSSFVLYGISKEGLLPADEKIEISYPNNAWQRELQWTKCTLPERGMALSQPVELRRSSNVIGATNTGNWSTKNFIPMGYLENTEVHSSLFWQIEHNGSWHWEISDHHWRKSLSDHDESNSQLYLQLSGPTETESHWWKYLAPGETFVSVPVAVGVSLSSFDGSMGELTKYRRIVRRPNDDDEHLPVIFNDYMNCLWGDPTTAKELPLIDAAARAGCEYFCIDCGWYSDGYWWDGVGEWLPSASRFPNGIREVMDYIRSKGMIPGVWLELEVMGIRCPKVKQVPDNWFFLRHGERVCDRSRYQLDFRNPEVVRYANEVIDRLVNEYGVGYIKMDYNIEPGIGTDYEADSAGDGLLGHNRAYLTWLDRIFKRHPALVIENCSSGGMRMDYAMLSRYSIQSTSDQEDYRYYATIAANAPSALTPEQAAVWSYPLMDGDEEDVVFNMVNAMLLRIHQSGHLANLSKERFALVQEAIACYKKIRQEIKNSIPIWPLGTSRFSDSWVSLALQTESRLYLAVWRRNSDGDTVVLPLLTWKGWGAKVKCIYPSAQKCRYVWNSVAGTLSVQLPTPFCARLFELNFQK